ncbi:molybdate ABC transporter permease subunit [Thiofilum flexile]|uniref:molybdate ABC transporter permease subunit n=1 Tax=Thiofilum flexile TaxID=125627 RepID=UPI000373F8FD|nr:molybdate ABC transporter permease subunit [Thiofilum flexile]
MDGLPFSAEDWAAIRLTLTLAGSATLILLLLGTPLAWWLSQTRSRFKPIIAALIAMPLILPPTVLGFYLLMLMGPYGWVGQLTQSLGLGRLPFSFSGMLVASVLFSMPFVVQPLQNTFEGLDARMLEAAATLRASPWDAFFSVVLPLSRRGFLTATILGFAHTVGEFGVVLMVGGNIPGQTRVVSMQIYNHVEAMQYSHAHWLAGLMVAFSFLVLISMQLMNQRLDVEKAVKV